MSPTSAAPEDPGLPIAEVAKRSGLTKDTLRCYERAGLIEAVSRTGGGQRRYAAADLDWLAFLLRLRATGMSIADMRRFAVLRRSGAVIVPERLSLLQQHSAAVGAGIAELQAHQRALDVEIAHYQGLLAEQSGNEDL